MNRRPLVAALAGAGAISFSAIFFALSEVSPLTGAFFRMAYALPPLALLWFRHRDGDGRSRPDRLLAMGAGGLLALDVIAWHASIGFIGAGLATLIANSQVVIVPLVSWAAFRERPARSALLAMPVVMTGLALISGMGRVDSFGSRPVLGVALAATAAALYSGFLIAYRRSNRALAHASGPLLDVTAGAALVALVVGLAAGGLDLRPTWPEHGWLLALGLGAQMGGWLAIGHALPRLPAAQTSFAIVLQPCLTLLWGGLLFGERPSWFQAIGVVLVLLAITLAVSGRSGTPVRTATRAPASPR